MKYVWDQCPNRRAHLPHVDETLDIYTICEGVTTMQALQLP